MPTNTPAAAKPLSVSTPEAGDSLSNRPRGHTTVLQEQGHGDASKGSRAISGEAWKAVGSFFDTGAVKRMDEGIVMGLHSWIPEVMGHFLIVEINRSC